MTDINNIIGKKKVRLSELLQKSNIQEKTDKDIENTDEDYNKYQSIISGKLNLKKRLGEDDFDDDWKPSDYQNNKKTEKQNKEKSDEGLEILSALPKPKITLKDKSKESVIEKIKNNPLLPSRNISNEPELNNISNIPMQSVNVDDLVGDDWERKYINRLQRQELFKKHENDEEDDPNNKRRRNKPNKDKPLLDLEEDKIQSRYGKQSAKQKYGWGI